MGRLSRGARRLLGGACLLVVLTLTMAAACDPPAINDLPMRQDGGNEVLFVGERGPLNVTFRNNGDDPVTVAGGAFYKPDQGIYAANPAGCVGTINPGNTCTMSFTRPGDNQVNQWYYLGQANEKALGGVILRG